MGYFWQSKYLFLFGIGLFLCSCGSKTEKQENSKKSDKTYVMYKPSEMALLMQEFYAYNETLRQQILEGKPLSAMPEEFKAIHTAEMTDTSGRTDVFDAYAPSYLLMQQDVIDSSNSVNVKQKFNNTINVCLACHKTECVGPIPRIKKLLIP